MLKKASVFNFFLKTFCEFIAVYIGKRVLNGDLIKVKMCFVMSLNLVSLIIILLLGPAC